MMRYPILVTVTTLTSLAALPSAAAAQYQTAPLPAAYAVANVTHVAPDGTRRAGLTLVVRDGLIETLAEGAEIPADARVLEGDSLVLYAGLVDAHGRAPVSWPEPRDVADPDEVRSWDPPRSRQGFLPHRRLADHLTATGDDLAEQRALGIVASLVHPDGGMAPGHAVLLIHRDGQQPWSLVHDPEPGLAMRFRSAGGVYPSQLFGVIAYLRQAFLDADHYRTLRAGGAGWDPDYEALGRATGGDLPVYFRADSDEDIRRMLDLADEVGFRPVLVGGQEAWKLADELGRRQVPVLASLDFPPATEWDPETDTIPDALEPAAAREKERLEDLWSNAGRLEAAGVRFALTTGGGETALLEGVRKAVEYGLSSEGALRAVSTVPAELLGLDGLTELREGGSATLLLADGDLLAEDTRVAYAFVEGHLTEGAGSNGEEAGGEEPAADLTGTWTGQITAGGQDADFTLELTQSDDGRLTGTMSASEMPTSPVSGSISGRDVTILIEAEGLPDPIRLRGTVSEDGDSMTGGGSTPFGEMTFEGRRGPGGGWAAWLEGGR
jgi:hypothetical protein